VFADKLIIMFKLKNHKIHKHTEKNKDLYSHSTGNDFNVNRYISLTYDESPSYFYIDEKFNENIFDFLMNNASIIKFSSIGKLLEVKKNIKNFRGGTFWFKYKDVYVKLTASGQEDEINTQDIKGLPYSFDFGDDNKQDFKVTSKKFDLAICAPASVQDFHFEDFEEFISVEEGSRVHLFIKDQYGDYTFQPINVNVPKDINLELNYGSKFLETDKLIKERLAATKGGLFMFHGPPGTGKTTYIKYLAGQINRDFIYIPTTMIENFTSDPNCLNILIQKTNSIIILEDAEKAIMKRHGDGMDSSAVSSLLNLSDGILSDILKTSVILTYNCPKSEIDSALKRKGRLQVDYEFGPLNVKDAKKLAKSLKHSKESIDGIDKPMSVADIYNLEKEVDLNEEKPEEHNERIIGFGKV
jgi:hypothetical protein